MDFRKRVDETKAVLAAAKRSVDRLRRESVKAEDELASYEEAREIVRGVGEAVQRRAHERLAGVVSLCLEMVFDEPYEFRIIFETKRNQTEARLVFVRDGLEVNPMDAAGGGVVDVAAFALRLSCLMLRRPAVRRLLILDEPFRFVSACYRPRVREMLEELAERMGVQIVMVTHVPELVTGKVVELR